jgi:hypothetical protein
MSPALPRDRPDLFGRLDRGADFIPAALIARNTSNGAVHSEFQKPGAAREIGEIPLDGWWEICMARAPRAMHGFQ